MSVEIARWRTRCDGCGDVYGNEWDTQDEARAEDEDAGGRCSDCADFDRASTEGEETR